MSIQRSGLAERCGDFTEAELDVVRALAVQLRVAMDGFDNRPPDPDPTHGPVREHLVSLSLAENEPGEDRYDCADPPTLRIGPSHVCVYDYPTPDDEYDLPRPALDACLAELALQTS